MDSTEAPQLIEHVSQSVSFTPFDTRWVPGTAQFVSCGVNPRGRGVLSVTQIARGEVREAARAETEKGVKCVSFGASAVGERKAAVGGCGGAVEIWCARESIGG